MAVHGGCEKADAWEAQRERNERYDRMFDKIEQHLGEQTVIMRDIARQGEQILGVRRDQKADRMLIEKLFVLAREQEKHHAAFQAEVNERFHQHEMEPVKEQRVERLRLSTGILLVVITTIINQLTVVLRAAFK
jgi:hypothetical protein